MLEDKFNVIYLALLIVISIVRKIYTRKFGGEKIKPGRGNIAEIIILSFVGLGMAAPLFFIFTSWLNFANFYLPQLVRWIGTIFFISACWFLWRSHADLGKGFTLYFHRIPKEETMMIKQFGEEYKKYMKKTGRIFPKFR